MTRAILPSTKEARKAIFEEVLASMKLREAEPEEKPEKPKKRLIIIVSQDMSGLGFADMATRQGEQVVLATKIEEPHEDDTPEKIKETEEQFEMCGKGIVDKVDLDEAMKRYVGVGTYWIFDQNYLTDYSMKLRKKGEKVFGSTDLTFKLENDRQFAVELAEKAGFDIPSTEEFSSIEEGISFIEGEEDNPDTAYVFKPDGKGEAYLTYVPNSEDNIKAKKELMSYMRSIPKDPGPYILQERKKGVEVNFEIWIYQGKPFFAFANLENKRKLNYDLGDNVGCAMDISWVVPLNMVGVQKTVLQYLKLPEFQDYTGFLDVNVIIADRGNWFLENCGRFGYSSHPNLFFNLAMDSFANIMCDFMDGKIEDFYSKFKYGFGASVLLYADHPQAGHPIFIPEDLEHKFYKYDLMKDGDEYKLCGANDIGIFFSHDYEIKSAAKDLLQDITRISYPNKAYRQDLSDEDYASNPIERYIALRAMGYLERT